MKNRLKKAFSHLKVLGLISNQKDLGEKMGYARASISKAMNGYEGYLTDNFIKEFCISFPNIFSENWLLTGQGNMLKSDSNNLEVSEPQVEYKKKSEDFSALQIIERNSNSIEKMVEIANRDSISIQKLVESNLKLIEILYENGITIPESTLKGGDYVHKEDNRKPSHPERRTKAG